MSTTTIRLPDDLKARVARAAKRTGTTPHNFILDAIAQKTEEQDRQSDFLDTADQRYAQIAASGETIPWDAMRLYLQQRIDGKPATRPVANKRPR